MERDTEDVYVFSDGAGYDLIDRYRKYGMPAGLRYAASVTGPWRVFGIYEMDDLAELPSLTQQEYALGSETAVAFRPLYLKKSAYHDVAAFVRIDVGDADVDEALETIRAIVKDPDDPAAEGEAESVQGSFDILAYVGGTDAATVAAIIRRIREVPVVMHTMTLRVIDYVTTNEQAPDDHRPHPHDAT